MTKTPFRISFFGGGSDYPEYYMKHGGAVLAASIDKFCYISCRELPPFFSHKYRIAYSSIETVQKIEEIRHPAVRGVFKHLNIENGVEVQHHGDLPARSGLGSSSSFTAGLLKAFHTLRGSRISNYELALETIHIEQNVIQEIVGSQDQMTVALGGLNHIEFCQDGVIKVSPLNLSPERIQAFNNHLLLFFTGTSRNSQEITKIKIEKIKSKAPEVAHLKSMVSEAMTILTSNSSITEIGKLLHEGWMAKRALSSNISTQKIDDIYQSARDNGALGGKLLGAGGGGFMLVFARPEDHPKICDSLSDLVRVPFKFEFNGSTVCLNEPAGL